MSTFDAKLYFDLIFYWQFQFVDCIQFGITIQKELSFWTITACHILVKGQYQTTQNNIKELQ